MAIYMFNSMVDEDLKEEGGKRECLREYQMHWQKDDLKQKNESSSLIKQACTSEHKKRSSYNLSEAR